MSLNRVTIIGYLGQDPESPSTAREWATGGELLGCDRRVFY